MKKYNEDILVFPVEAIKPQWFEGYCPYPKQCFDLIFVPGITFFLDRNVAEDDPTYKQIIPYVTIRCGDRYLSVRRSKKINEGRLAGKRSVGIGGHVNTDDVGGKIDGDPFLIFQRGLLREIEEELDFKGKTIPQWVLYGAINTTDGGVGSVHFGIHYLIDVESEDSFIVQDDGLIEHRWLTLDELLAEKDEYEAWSQIVIENI